MQRFADVADAVASTSSKNEKVRLLGQYLRSLPPEEAALAALFFTGRPFPRSEETVTSAGGALLFSSSEERNFPPLD